MGSRDLEIAPIISSSLRHQRASAHACAESEVPGPHVISDLIQLTV